jgi:hypothetical protein
MYLKYSVYKRVKKMHVSEDRRYVAVAYEQNSPPAGSIKDGEFLKELSDHWLPEMDSAL